ncbi:MAG: DUF1800 domain-containing protein [Thermoanaerobaculia bacterium]
MTQPLVPPDRSTYVALRRRREARLRRRALPDSSWGREAVRRWSTPPSLALRAFAAEAFEQIPDPPAAGVIALTRLGFGPRPGELAAFEALGATDPQRLQIWVDEQLDPASIDDSEAEARLAAASFESLDKSLVDLWQDYVVADPPWEIRMRPYFETERATLLRGLYSRRQLFELLVDFWHNHFNVYAYEFGIGPIWVHSDRDVIRANALGNFRVMLEAVAQSPAMLRFLDNRDNSVDGPNENYGREVLELHSLGVDAYYGSIPKDQVPLDGQGKPLGYVDEDVTACARSLTGWTMRDRPWDENFGDTGEFFVYEPWHDTDEKRFLDVTIPAGGAGLPDGRAALDAIAAHPATARFIARKLCRRLVADQPPQALVDAGADAFTQHAGALDQLARVVRAIVLAPEFPTFWGQKVKRPLEIALSALRSTAADWDFSLDDEDTDSLLWRSYNAGQPLFSWPAPNGYPDIKEAWITTGPRVMNWRLTNWFSEVQDDADAFRLDLLGQTPPEVRSARALADFWVDRILGRAMPAAEQDEIVEFMAQGINPDLDLPLDTDEDVQSRLRAMIGLIFMSPCFLWK